jgi:integrase
MSSAAVRKLVLIAREKFAADLGADLGMFNSSFWDVSCLKDRAFNRTNRRVYFTRYGTNDQPLPADYSRVVKSWLVLDRRSPGNMGLRLAGARILWEAILTRRSGEPATFRWQTLSEEDLSQAELLMRAHWSLSTTYKRMMSLLVFTRFLASRNLCRPLYYTPQTPRVEDFNRHTIAGQQARRDRLPTEAVLNGLADIYREHAVEPRDKLRAAALAILVVTGFRIGELLTLPLDCEVRETRGGQPRYGLRYYREKSMGSTTM